jgi:hypothetical protein
MVLAEAGALQPSDLAVMGHGMAYLRHGGLHDTSLTAEPLPDAEARRHAIAEAPFPFPSTMRAVMASLWTQADEPQE